MQEKPGLIFNSGFLYVSNFYNVKPTGLNIIRFNQSDIFILKPA